MNTRQKAQYMLFIIILVALGTLAIQEFLFRSTCDIGWFRDGVSCCKCQFGNDNTSGPYVCYFAPGGIKTSFRSIDDDMLGCRAAPSPPS